MRAPSLLDALRRRLAEAPEAPFAHLVQGDRTETLTIAGLAEAAARWAGLLAAQGCRPGETVLIILRHGPAPYAAFLGAMMAGAVPAFLPFATPKQDPRLYWQAHDALLRRIGPARIVTWPENAAALRAHLALDSHRLHLLGEEAGAAPLRDWRDGGGGEIALLQHSSGTTGLKKGVALSHAAILAQLDAYAEAIGFAPGDVVASWLPLYHDMGLVACFLLPLVKGGAVASLDAFDWVARPATLPAAIAAHRARWCWLPNFAFEHLVRTRRPGEHHDLSSLRALIDCSEVCRAETLDRFATAFADCGITQAHLQCCYAMAETVFAVTQTPPGRPAPRLLLSAEALAQGRAVPPAPGERAATLPSVGRPIAGLALRILDEAGGPLPEGRVGEVALRGDCLFQGWHADPAASAAAFTAGWYRTGDLGALVGGELVITGRRKEVIKLNGRSVHAPDLEALAHGIPGLHPGRAVALGLPDAASGSEALVLVAETTLTEEPARRDLQRALRATIEAATGLAGAGIALRPPGWLVKTTSGKLSRAENLAKYLSEAA
ncbi:AMP-binding protein [Paracraurococcus lichenis]|uniref:AMP-binding protein n=1 Tax=Paracraurococcus lichenis TaxID=3064888 RepID=A0ABT9E7C7_9PROT|nr:AMP-binding protein [Paracraurococcus sp. LOR1-02]MDO9712078.1 AMP-binding protein [Paracraurococcus sp. LOR1-02]